MRSPRSKDDLAPAWVQRWRWLAYHVRFHAIVTRSLPRLLETLEDYAKLMRLDRPVGIWLLLWPTLWALWIASSGKPNPKVFGVFVVGVLLMRSAGCVINDFADRNVDPHVQRTRTRPLAIGSVSPAEALVLFLILALSALMLVLQLNRLTVLMSLVGAALTMIYPFMKRFFALPQFFLGVAFGWGIPMAFTAQTEVVPRVAWLLFIGNILWCAVYDTIYAMIDREDDLRIGVRSSAIFFGEADRQIIAVMQVMALLALYLAGRAASMGPWFAVGLAAAAAFFVRQLILIRGREPDSCFAAFTGNNYVGMAVFVGIALDYLFRK